MDRGLWSLGSVMIGTAAAVIGIDWTFAVCGAVCAIAALSLLHFSHRAVCRLPPARRWPLLFNEKLVHDSGENVSRLLPAENSQIYATMGSRSGIWLGIFGTRVRGWPLTPALPAPKRSILPVPVLQS